MSKLYIGVVLILITLSLVACQPLQAPEAVAGISGYYSASVADESSALREVFGNVDVTIVDPATHQAEGTINYYIASDEPSDIYPRHYSVTESPMGIQATAQYAVFDAAQDRAVIVARIDKTMGDVDGVPGEFACFWVKNDVEGDQFGMHYYTHFYSDEPGVIRSKIYWPADSQFLSSQEMAAASQPERYSSDAYIAYLQRPADSQFLGSEEAAMAVQTELYGDEWNSDFLIAMQKAVPDCAGGNCFEVDGMAESAPSMIIDIAHGDIAFVPAS